MLDYTIKVLLFQTLFLVIYDLVLKKETFFQWNRFYLIFTTILAYIIPFIKVQRISEVVSQEYVILLPEVVLSPQTMIKEQFDWSAFVFTSMKWIFMLGVIVAFALFLVKLFKVFQLIRSSEIEKEKGYHLVFLESKSPFSFFNYIFLNKSLSKNIKQQIIEHELVHVKQKHSIDLLFFESQRIIFWFNPFSYIYQKRIAELHEYIADSKSIKTFEKADYFQNLLNRTFDTEKISFINPFFKNSLIKKRIVMFNKQRSKQLFKFKYLVLLPLLAGMLIYSSCGKDNNSPKRNKKNKKRLTILYMGGDGILDKKEIKTKKEGYFDMYLFGAKPTGKEITYSDLTENEKDDFDKYMLKIKNSDNGNYFSHKIYLMEDGTKAIMQHIDWKDMKAFRNSKDYSNAKVVPYANVDRPPIFPGCEDAEDQFNCFKEKVSEHIKNNFDYSIAKSLGLSAGKKRIYVQFRIKDDGMISDVQVRAPHKSLEDQTQEIVYDLPIMKPGEHQGRKVAVKYTLPISFVVE